MLKANKSRRKTKVIPERLKWEVLNTTGSNNFIFINRSTVLPLVDKQAYSGPWLKRNPKSTRSAISNSSRQFRLFKEINPSWPLKEADENLIVPYFENASAATDDQIALLVFDIFKKTRRLFVDPCIEGNVLVNESDVFAVDVELCLRPNSPSPVKEFGEKLGRTSSSSKKNPERYKSALIDFELLTKKLLEEYDKVTVEKSPIDLKAPKTAMLCDKDFFIDSVIQYIESRAFLYQDMYPEALRMQRGIIHLIKVFGEKVPSKYIEESFILLLGVNEFDIEMSSERLDCLFSQVPEIPQSSHEFRQK